MSDTRKYRVRKGAELGHHGETLREGAEVELPPHVAREIKHLVDPVNPATDEIEPWDQDEMAALQLELAKSRPHERVSLIEAAIKANQEQGEELAALLKQAKKDEAAAAKPATKPAAKPTEPAKPAADAPKN